MEKGDYREHRSISSNRGGLWWMRGGISRLSSALAKASSLSLVRSLTAIFEGARSTAPGPRFPIYRSEPVLPLDVSSPRLGVELLAFGDGAFYGEQPPLSPLPEGDIPLWGGGDSRKHLYWVDLPRGVVIPGARIGLVASGEGEPLLMDLDWFLSRSGTSIGFVKDPSHTDVMWIFDSFVDHGDVFKNFGFVEGLDQNNAEESSRFASAATRLSTVGPTYSAVEAFVSAAAGQQLAPESGEIQDVSTTPKGETIVTVGGECAIIGPGIPILDRIVAGGSIEKGGAISSATRVLNPVANPGWWREFQAINIRMPFDGGCFLVFPNSMSKEWPPTPLSSPRAVQEFSSAVEWGDAPAGITNLAEVAAESIIGPTAVPIVVDLSQVENTSLFFSRLAMLPDCLPPSSVVVVSAFLPIEDVNQGLSAADGENRVSDIGLPIPSFSAGPPSESGVSVHQRSVHFRRF